MERRLLAHPRRPKRSACKFGVGPTADVKASSDRSTATCERSRDWLQTAMYDPSGTLRAIWTASF